MQTEIYFLFFQCVTLCFLNTNAFIGQRVRQAEITRFRYVASIQKAGQTQNENDHICTGILVSIKDVLTVERCVSVNLSGIQIVLGATDMTLGWKTYPKWWLKYNEWIRQNHLVGEHEMNDIAIIRLVRPVPNTIHPVIMHVGESQGLHGEFVDSFGWGMLYNGHVSRLLMQASLKILNNTDCEDRVEALQHKRYAIPSRFLCTYSDPFAILTRGDSGGPVLYQERLIAINLQAIPLDEEPFNHHKVNLHLILDPYRHFIFDAIYNIDI